MPWIPLVAWLAAAMLGAVVLGFCGYELVWKSRRLRADLERLDGLRERLIEVRTTADAVQRRLVTVGPAGSARPSAPASAVG